MFWQNSAANGIVPKSIALSSVLLTACFRYGMLALWLREGNDNPHWMDYWLVASPILYPLRPEGIRGYFSYDISRSIAVGINQRSIRCTVQPTLDPLAAKLRLFLTIGIIDRDEIAVYETGLAGVGLLSENDADAR
jgi:hypothetical protein